MSVLRRAILRAALPLAWCGPVLAQTLAEAPTAPITAFNTALRAGMQAGRATPFATRAAALRPAVERAFDLPAILQASVGPRFAGFPDAGKSALLESFTNFTVATWTANFDVLDGERFEVEPATRKSGEDAIVTTRIVPRTGAPTRLDYVMRQAVRGGTAGWKAVDILLNGTISRVAVQRSDFRKLVTSGDAAPLIASLDSRAANLAAGTSN